ncbi:MAG: SDR family oxidoreductase [Actinobacteria bacterium]|nr:SDR family oxidoreductase [Actinomycetota bacterium]
MSPSRILVTGSTGYVGGRVVPALLGEGHAVRCLVRTPAKLSTAVWIDEIEVVQGSVDGDLSTAMADIDVAIYLIHSIGEGDNWAERELQHAENFAGAAHRAGVKRIVYLGGLGASADELSVHLQSRQNVGEALAATGVPTVELRAGVIIGSASASFELLRYLVEVLPIMVTPKWVTTRCQPISINDIVNIVVAATSSEEEISGVYEAGGSNVVTYAEMMSTYARCAGLRRRILIPVPLLTPRLSSHWIGLVTPVPVPLAKELVKSLVNEVIVTQNSACEAFGISPMSLKESITRALAVTQAGVAPTSFSDADLIYFQPNELDPDWAGGTEFRDIRHEELRLSAQAVFEELTTIGGEKGWYSASFLWKIRGLIDQIIGGPGMRRGRKKVLQVGDALDFWRIEEVQEGRSLRLRAEMRLPGKAWLTWHLAEVEGVTTITQIASFRPRGLLGRVYWAAVWPFHGLIFPSMLKRMATEATRRAQSA